MREKKIKYSLFQRSSALFMIASLLWLTISSPFVLAAQQELAKQHKMEKASIPADSNDEETANPFGNNTEEKAPGNSNSFSEDYLHDHHTADHFFSIALQYHKIENAAIYIAYHGELHVPPPNAA